MVKVWLEFPRLLIEGLGNMKKILFVGAGFFQIEGIKKAKELGFWTIAIDDNQYADGKKIADEFYQVDITNRAEVLRLAIEKNIDGVVAIASEISMESVSFVTSEMGLNGYGFDLIDIAHDKNKYYQLFGKNGINVPKTYKYNNSEDLIENIDEQNIYFIKPSKGSGSRGVIQANNISSFDFSYYAKKYLKNEEEILIQKMIEGVEMTVDGFILDKKFHLLAVSEEINNKEKGHTFSSELIFPPEWLQERHLSEISCICNKVIDCLEIECPGPIHLELILTPEDNIFLIDFSLRGGGFDLFTKIIEKTSGIDVLSVYLKTTLGEPVTIPGINNFKPVTLSFIYPELAGVIKKINGKELEGNYEDYSLKFFYKEGDFIATPESGKQRLAYYICWAENYAIVFKQRDFIREHISLEIDHA